MENYHLSKHTASWKESMINRLSNLINRNRSAAKISQVLCSSKNSQTSSDDKFCSGDGERSLVGGNPWGRSLWPAPRHGVLMLAGMQLSLVVLWFSPACFASHA